MTAAPEVSFAADFPDAEVCPSPNFGERAAGKSVDMIILHYTGMESTEKAQAWLCNPQSQVSSHYLVQEDGRVVQMVPETKRAWHAGKSFWRGETDINSRSIGIEIANPGHAYDYPDFSTEQIRSVIELCRNCVAKWAIPVDRVLGHSDVAPGRKVDPGEKFPWSSLFDAGVGHWVDPSQAVGGRFLQAGDRGQPVEALQAMLSLYGYNVEVTGEFDDNLRAVVYAFQQHFRPSKVDGVADAATIETLYRLTAALPSMAK